MLAAAASEQAERRASEARSGGLSEGLRAQAIEAEDASTGRKSVVPALPRRNGFQDSDWLSQHAGLCADGTDTGPGSARARYLATFLAVPAWHTTLFVDPVYFEPAADLFLVRRVREDIQALPKRVKDVFGLESEPPAVYLHRSPEALRANVCVNRLTVAYYDGAIHLSSQKRQLFAHYELMRGLSHEYVHHALQSHGIRKPIWFQEGAALVFSAEFRSKLQFPTRVLALREMVDGFPVTAEPAFVETFYVQAYAMTSFIQSLCLKDRRCGMQALVEVLISGRVAPDELFEWAVARHADVLGAFHLGLLEDYVARGYQLDPSVQRGLRTKRELLSGQ